MRVSFSVCCSVKSGLHSGESLWVEPIVVSPRPGQLWANITSFKTPEAVVHNSLFSTVCCQLTPNSCFQSWLDKTVFSCYTSGVNRTNAQNTFRLPQTQFVLVLSHRVEQGELGIISQYNKSWLNHTHIYTQPFVQDYTGKPEPEETFTHSHHWTCAMLTELTAAK